jgi:inner membrane transporter RhtA
VTQRATTGPAHIPPTAYFIVSAIFHYLGPSFAVLLFAHIGVLGVAWLRIASAAVVFALWRRPWRYFQRANWEQRKVLIALGVVLGLMNASFYLAIARLPLGTVGAIGARTRRNLLALGLAIAGGSLLANVQLEGQPLGLVFAAANCVLFMLYVVLGHRIAQDGSSTGIDRLGASMLVAFVVILPIGLGDALPAFTDAQLLLAGIAVGICSSVIPYITDQLVMASLPRATFALMLSLLPAIAAVIGAVVLRQIPTPVEIAGIALIMSGIAVHRDREVAPKVVSAPGLQHDA